MAAQPVEVMARRAWRELVRQRELVPYGKLASRIGYSGPRPINHALGKIYWFCENLGLPILTSIVVNSTTGKPNPKGFGDYTVRGLRRLQQRVFDFDWSKVDFIPELGEDGENSSAVIRKTLKRLRRKLEREGAFNPQDLEDARLQTLRGVVLRQGQPAFRKKLLRAYEGRCAMTGFEVTKALEAAHIHPYRGPETNDVRNGLLLRSDIHTLFDLRLISVNPNTRKVALASELRRTSLKYLEGRRLRRTVRPEDEPSHQVLEWHFRECRFSL